MGLTRNALYKLTHDARQKLKRGLEAAGIDGDGVREAFAL
jgi:RNA polymerase sigma-70 factor (ECF subfamily)